MFKKTLADDSPQAWNLGKIGTDSFQIASAGASVANTTIQQLVVPPTNVKIAKVAIAGTAINAVDGTHKFNIVLGTVGAYTAGTIAANDNSSTNGYPTNVASGAVALFSADVAITSAAANAFSATTANGTTGCLVPGTGWIKVTTTGFYGIFVPDSYDAVYPAGVPLGLRLVTPATTGSITNLCVTMLLEPRPLSPTYVPQTISQPPIQPGSAF